MLTKEMNYVTGIIRKVELGFDRSLFPGSVQIERALATK